MMLLGLHEGLLILLYFWAITIVLTADPDI